MDWPNPIESASASGSFITILEIWLFLNLFVRCDRLPRSGERPITVLEVSSLGGSDIPSNVFPAGQSPRA